MEFESALVVVRGALELRKLVLPADRPTLGVCQDESYIPVECQHCRLSLPHHIECLALKTIILFLQLSENKL